MRKNQKEALEKGYKILALDDDTTMTLTLQTYFQRSGHKVDVESDPNRAIERVRVGNYDLLLLDFLMTPICGDVVVEQIREFNRDIYIILLTGHKSMAPPIKTIRELDIQGYYEKSDRFDQLELLVESCFKSIQQMRTIKEYQKGLSEVIEAIPKVYSMRDIGQVAEHILKTAIRLLDGQAGFFVYKPSILEKHDSYSTNHVHQIITYGKELTQEEETHFKKLVTQIKDIKAWHEDERLNVLVLDEQNMPVGLLGIYLKEKQQYHQTQLLEVFSRQITSALGNVRLNALLTQKNEELSRAYSSLNDSYFEIISAMRLLVDAKDIYTRGHSDRVSYYAVRIAREMNMEDSFCEQIRVAGLFHDIGKVGIPDEILLKRGRLSESEYERIKEHSSNGSRILSSLSSFQGIAPIVRSHHERMDGKGYPDGLKGSQIPLGARIIAVVDAYDAMTSNRRYRVSLGEDKAVKELVAGKDIQFDAKIVEVFLEILKDKETLENDLRYAEEA